MIGEGIGLAHLLPVALDLLEADPWTQGDLYPGDLLVACAEASSEERNSVSDASERLAEIANQVLSDEQVEEASARTVTRALSAFLDAHRSLANERPRG